MMVMRKIIKMDTTYCFYAYRLLDRRSWLRNAPATNLPAASTLTFRGLPLDWLFASLITEGPTEEPRIHIQLANV